MMLELGGASGILSELIILFKASRFCSLEESSPSRLKGLFVSLPWLLRVGDTIFLLVTSSARLKVFFTGANGTQLSSSSS